MHIAIWGVCCLQWVTGLQFRGAVRIALEEMALLLTRACCLSRVCCYPYTDSSSGLWASAKISTDTHQMPLLSSLLLSMGTKRQHRRLRVWQ